MNQHSFATRSNSDIIEDRFRVWKEHPEELDSQWQAFFEGFELAASSLGQYGSSVGAVPMVAPDGTEVDISEHARTQARVIGLIYAYRSLGHTEARINPLLREAPSNPRLSLERLGLEGVDLDQAFDTGNYRSDRPLSIGELLERLQRTYCGSVGIEYLHLQDTPKRRWIQARIEPDCFQPRFSKEAKAELYSKLAEAEDFEKILHSRFTGQKRFSLEGGESLITALNTIVNRLPQIGMKEIVMGMAHRGRLNVLANVLRKSRSFIFREFSPDYAPDEGGDSPSGDVKYHLGYDNVVETAGGETVEIRLAANPSHLEAVNAVVEGRARARQRILGDLAREQVLPILIHGDAAIAGQGVVAEVCNFSKLPGYRTGGTIHIVVNNQIGFTTNPEEARSSRYCTDVAKMIEAPILHVNGNDPLAVAMAAELALDYRAAFQEDIFLDIVCYRKHGHNEADEPLFTQPLLYKQINELHSPREELSLQLRREGELSGDEIEEIDRGVKAMFEDAYEKAALGKVEPLSDIYEESTAAFQPDYSFAPVPTRVDAEALRRVARGLTTVPEGFQLNRKIQRQLTHKWKSFEEDSGMDWAFGEGLAFGTLLVEGSNVRLSGQDSERGTFSQRHAVFYDTATREAYCPFDHLAPDQARFCVHNSLLSEAAVLGFDFGYSLEYENMLGLWEAQFGDFANGAQVVIDQFIFSSEAKWRRVSGLVMLLPHGYEGQGPEHSSARLERYLQNCAENNIQVCNVTTPAQYFHVLRRQMKREFRKPLVLMTPKSLLRHKWAVSRRKEFTDVDFQTVLDDPEAPENPEVVVYCSGKVYYDLLEARRREDGPKGAALVRLEQYYPLDREELLRVHQRHAGAREVVWCQEEPANMGAWSFLQPQFEEILGCRPRFAGRAASASPATGFHARHVLEQEELVQAALRGRAAAV